MEQLRLNAGSFIVRSEEIAAAIRPALDDLLPRFNLSPRHISFGVLSEKGNPVGISISYSIAPSVLSVSDETGNKAGGSVICRIKDQTKQSYIEFPADRARFYSTVGESTSVGASAHCLRVNLPAYPDLNSIASSVCADIDSFLRNYPCDIGCCHLYQSCSDAGHCISENQDMAAGCYYKRNLLAGKVFYGNKSKGGVLS